jgi:hypothetical protein
VSIVIAIRNLCIYTSVRELTTNLHAYAFYYLSAIPMITGSQLSWKKQVTALPRREQLPQDSQDRGGQTLRVLTMARRELSPKVLSLPFTTNCQRLNIDHALWKRTNGQPAPWKTHLCDLQTHEWTTEARVRARVGRMKQNLSHKSGRSASVCLRSVDGCRPM